MEVKILREPSTVNGVFGDLFIDDEPFCITLELPDRGNRPEISCIPEGCYICRRHNSPHFGIVFQIMDVPGRSSVLIHPANTIDDLKGCIGLGSSRAIVKSPNGQFARPGIINSRITFDSFMEIMDGLDEFTLEVKYV